MQKVAAYLMERYDGMSWSEARTSEALKLRKLVESWLQSKGASEIAPAGAYHAEDGSQATFSIEEAADHNRTWWMARLQEVTNEGRRFLAAVSITNGSDKVSVYITLEVGSDVTQVSPFDFDPKCPKIVRTFLHSPVRWHHGFTELRRLRQLRGFEAGEGLAEEIKHPDRTVPFIVISEGNQGIAIPDLDKTLSFDLSGIANVVVLDSDATWALTDYLGPSLSCHSGAVRLYWPRFSFAEDPHRHPLWTVSRLLSAGTDLEVTSDRFRRQLRSIVMHAAALSVVRPREIDDIRGSASRRAFAEFKDRATSVQDYADLAEMYAKNNDQLLATNTDLTIRVDELQISVARLESERTALLSHLRAARGATTQQMPDTDEIAPDPGAETDEDSAPAYDEIRYYKKKFSAPNHDLMVRVSDCSHNRWQNAHAADKAKKGIAKLEKGRTDWQVLQHCGTCTGGGMWRVRW